MSGTRDLKIIHYEGTGEIEIFVDGQAMPVAEAERITRDFQAGLSAGMGVALALTSAIEQHRAGGVQHGHVIGHHTHKAG